jgi:deazaflavin-dependent oxidoreductase (nitroreductase family)
VLREEGVSMAALGPIRPFTTRVINPLMRPLARVLPGFAIVSYRGRRSGRPYRTPVMVFHDGSRFVFALTHGPNVQWAKNILAAGTCAIEKGGRTSQLDHPVLFVDASGRVVPRPVRIVFRVLHVKEYLAMTPVDAPASRPLR